MADRAIQAVIFDLDNTLTDFMLAKENSIRAAVMAMIDAGLQVSPEEATDRIFAIYKEKGIEHQRVFNFFLEEIIGRVDDRILAAAVVAYRRGRDGSLTLYPHAKLVLNRLLKQGYKLAVVSDAPRFEAWIRLTYLGLQHTFDLVLTFDDTGAHKPDQKLLFATNGNSNDVSVIDVQSLKVIKSIPTGTAPWGVTISQK